MDDDLRKSVGMEDESFIVEEEKAPEVQSAAGNEPRLRVLGMTAPQRFIVAVMLFMLVCVLGSLLLVVSEKVVLPF